MSEIYALCDPSTGFPRYVGKTTATGAKRLREHVANAARGVTRHRRLASWIRSLDAPPTLLVLEVDPPDLNEAERAWIHMYRRYGAKLCNMTDGGDGQSPGYVPSAEARAKNSSSLRGRIKSEQERENLRRALTGHEVSLGTRAKIGAANRGKTRTADQKERQSAAVEGERNPFYGRKHSATTRAKMSAARKGVSLTAEHRAKIAAAGIGRRHTAEARAKMAAAARTRHALRAGSAT